ncbi:MAG: glucose 1-dehydrogenase [Thermoproteota archaeon]|nr:glucose 1-dehydrogenase [Thermoproteota archaeon]MDQ3971648.1 glucose 1-dehydrogenase [Thermoproteota archaeon]
MTEVGVRSHTKRTGKVAVITGSSKGIGRAIALAFAKSNTYSGIVVNARKREEAERVAKEVQDIGNSNSIAVIADVSQEADCIRLIDEIVKYYGRIDVLVNNAGIQQEVPFEDTSIEVWQKIIAVDLTGPFVCSREAVKHMLNQNPKGGCIINISSVHQIIPKPHYLPYATSKAGIEMMTKTLALELAHDNIRVNAVAPGAIETDMNEELKEDRAELNKVLRRIPLRRIGTSEEVANMVEFLASDKASYVTGSTFFVDGGMTLYPSFGPSFDLDQRKEDSA